jgi:hypothetical protein
MKRKVHIDRYSFHPFVIQKGLKLGDASSPLLFNLALEYAGRRVQENLVELKLSWAYQLLAYPGNFDLLGNEIV